MEAQVEQSHRDADTHQNEITELQSKYEMSEERASHLQDDIDRLNQSLLEAQTAAKTDSNHDAEEEAENDESSDKPDLDESEGEGTMNCDE